MKKVLLSALALGAMTTAATAEPQAMSDDQLAGVAAGVATGGATVVQDIAQSQAAFGLALDLGGGGKGLPICCVLPPIDGGNGGASVDIDQNQVATNNAVVTVTETVTNVLPPTPPAPTPKPIPCGGCFFVPKLH